MLLDPQTSCFSLAAVVCQGTLGWWFGLVVRGFEHLVLAEGKWKNPGTPPNYQSKPPIRGKLSDLGVVEPLSGFWALLVSPHQGRTCSPSAVGCFCQATRMQAAPGLPESFEVGQNYMQLRTPTAKFAKGLVGVVVKSRRWYDCMCVV